jgi:formylglycine-generating enzyme required for sulfatase activity/uncharacterized caspase-like protein
MKMKRLLSLLVVVATVLSTAASAFADSQKTDLGRYYALIFGNNDYMHLARLQTAAADANAFGEMLRTQYGFKVELHLNATREQIVASLNRLRSELSEKDNLVVFYAGHGYVDSVTDTGFWLPVDAQPDNEVNWIPVSEISRNLLAISARHVLVVADSCYSGTLTRAAPVRVPANTDAWVQRMASKRSRTALTSGGIEPVVDGSADGQHSVFSKAILDALRSNDDAIPGETLFARLRDAVVVNAQQTPQYADIRNAGHDGGDFIFMPRPDIARLTQAAPPPSATSAPDPTIEREFWNAIKDSNDPAMFEAHIQQFPNGFLTPLARLKIRELKGKEQTSATAAAVLPVPAPAPPEARPAVEEMEESYEVLTNVSVREQPTASSKRIGQLEAGGTILVTGKVADANWYRVETADGKVGYVFGGNVRKAVDGAVAMRGLPPPGVPPRATAPPDEPPPRSATTAPGAVAATTAFPAAPRPAPAPSPKGQSRGFRDCPECPEMIALPGGVFQMGSNDDPSEKPVHRVAIRAFALGRYPVTAGQWAACVADGACDYRPKEPAPADDLPMGNLSWKDADQLVRWLGRRTGRPYRLPTEAEWEYAARAGTGTRYWWGNEVGVAKADCKGCGGPWITAHPAPVGTFAPNPFGLYEMHGGIAEWVADCWHPNYAGAPADGSAHGGGRCDHHVLRGGSWRSDPGELRASNRTQYETDVRYPANGLRVARDID